MSEPIACPKCGADLQFSISSRRLTGFHFECGTRINPALKKERKVTYQSDCCRLVQLENLLRRVIGVHEALGELNQSLLAEIETVLGEKA